MSQQFAVALWSRLDNTGFPSGTFYFVRGFLQLPHPPDMVPSDLFRRWIRGQRFPRCSNKPSTRERNTLCDEIIGASRAVQWSDEEVDWLIQQLATWWDADKKYLKGGARVRV